MDNENSVMQSEIDSLRDMIIALSDEVQRHDNEIVDKENDVELQELNIIDEQLNDEVHQTDEQVSCITGDEPGYLGDTESTGVIRSTDGSITMLRDNTTDEDLPFKNLAVDPDSIIEIITDPATGDPLLPLGIYHGQILWWDNINSVWILSVAPTSPSVLVFDKTTDTTNGTVRWEEIDTDLKIISRNTADNIDDDWLRIHA
jgi:hypothetical protein